LGWGGYFGNVFIRIYGFRYHCEYAPSCHGGSGESVLVVGRVVRVVINNFIVCSFLSMYVVDLSFWSLVSYMSIMCGAVVGFV
jgi:hypothetical protein